MACVSLANVLASCRLWMTGTLPWCASIAMFTRKTTAGKCPPVGSIQGKTPSRLPSANCAQRELMEESGYRAGQLLWVSTYHTSKSVCHETAHLFLGKDLSAAEAPPDETEFFERAIWPFAEVLRMVETSEIRDSMTVIAVLHAVRLRAQGQW